MKCAICSSDKNVVQINTINDHGYKTYGYICEECLAYCDDCNTLYAKNGDCCCNNFTEKEMIGKFGEYLEEKSDSNVYFDTCEGDLCEMVQLTFANHIVKKNFGVDTTAFMMDENVILVSDDEAKMVMANKNMFGIKLLFQGEEGHSIFTAPLMSDGSICGFLYSVQNFNSALLNKNLYCTNDLIRVLGQAVNHFQEIGKTEIYLFVKDMLTITKGVDKPFASIDMRTDNIMFYDAENRYVPYDAIYFRDYVYCSDCDNELYDCDETVFHKHRAYCAGCLNYCECGEVISADDQYCSDCMDNNYFTCEKCEELTHNDDKYEFEDGTQICNDCREDLKTGTIDHYDFELFLKTVENNTVSNMTFEDVRFGQKRINDISSIIFDECKFIDCLFDSHLFGNQFKDCIIRACTFDEIWIENIEFSNCQFLDSDFIKVIIKDSRIMDGVYFNTTVNNAEVKNSLVDSIFLENAQVDN